MKDMDIQAEINNLKKELLLLRIRKVTKQKQEVNRIREIKNRISQIQALYKQKSN